MNQADQDASKRQQFSPPAPFMVPTQQLQEQQQQQQQQQIGAYSTSSITPESSYASDYAHSTSRMQVPSAPVIPSNPQFANQYYVSQDNTEPNNYSWNTASRSADHSISLQVGLESRASRRPSITQSPMYPRPQNTTSYSPSQQTNYSSTYGTSKSRSNAIAVTGYYPENTQSYLLGSKSSMNNTAKPRHNNEGPISILLLPPLLLLLICEMSTSLPLLLFFCISLIVYALDLANPGDRGNSGGGVPRGYYTLCAIWLGWAIMSFVVGYHLVFLDEKYSYSGSVQGNSTNGNGRWHLMGIAALTCQLLVSILLLFCLVSQCGVIKFAFHLFYFHNVQSKCKCHIQ